MHTRMYAEKTGSRTAEVLARHVSNRFFEQFKAPTVDGWLSQACIGAFRPDPLHMWSP